MSERESSLEEKSREIEGAQSLKQLSEILENQGGNDETIKEITRLQEKFDEEIEKIKENPRIIDGMISSSGLPHGEVADKVEELMLKFINE